MRKQVKAAVAAERLAELQALLDAQAAEFNRQSVGRIVPVLLERPGRHPGQLVGRTPWLQTVHVAAPGLTIGSLVELRLVADHAHSLAGRLPADLEEVSA
jgi:tRNA-2-methylthio-N6-dimethylallyladenosine synthase